MAWADNNYRHKKPITIDHTLVAGDETNFPVLINVTDADLAVCLANGYDIKFYNDDEDTQLKHERQEWTQGTGTLIAWVKVNALSSTEDTLIYIYYNYALEGVDQADPENVWDDNFVMVQHMIDETTSTTLDSTSNDNDGDKTGANAPIENADGKIGKCQFFDGAADFIDCGVDNSLDITTGLTASIWYKVGAGLHDRFIACHKVGDYGWMLGGIGGSTIAFYMSTTGADWNGGSTAAGTYKADDTWNNVVGTYDGTNMRVYLGGAEHNGGVFPLNKVGVINAPAEETYIGKDGFDSVYHLDYMDEVRLSKTNRGANWINTSYESMDDPAAFMGFGGELSRPGKPRGAGYIYGLKTPKIVRTGHIGV